MAGGAREQGEARLGFAGGSAARLLQGLADAWPWRAWQGRAWRQCRRVRHGHPDGGGHGEERWAQMGLARACGWAGGGRREDGSGLQARPSRIGFVFFRIYFKCESNSRKI
jgi:hypothetical protein